MSKSYPSLVLITLLAVAFAGCNTRPLPPGPNDTLSGGQTGERIDWIDTEDIYGPGAEGLERRDQGIGTGLLKGEKNILESVYFDFDQSAINNAEREKLKQMPPYLLSNPSERLLLEGHCDWRGTAEYNLGLGDRRARSVKQYLITLGVSEDRLETVSKGDLEAVAEGSDEERAHDRRVDLIILP